MGVWKSIIEYKNTYEVSDLGEVRSLDRYISTKGGALKLQKGKTLKPVEVPNGYLVVMLSFEGKATREYVHRLVARAFKDNPEGKPYVNHLNGIKTDNSEGNLIWCSPKENSSHAISIGLITNGGEHPRAIKVQNCRGEEFSTLKEAAAKFNLTHHGRISEVLNLGRGSAGKYPDGSRVRWKKVTS